MHKGPAGTIELNRALKAHAQPGPGAHGGFDPGDRVVAIANHIDEGFANGEVGTVTGPADEGLIDHVRRRPGHRAVQAAQPTCGTAGR